MFASPQICACPKMHMMHATKLWNIPSAASCSLSSVQAVSHPLCSLVQGVIAWQDNVSTRPGHVWCLAVFVLVNIFCMVKKIKNGAPPSTQCTWKIPRRSPPVALLLSLAPQHCFTAANQEQHSLSLELYTEIPVYKLTSCHSRKTWPTLY